MPLALTLRPVSGLNVMPRTIARWQNVRYSPCVPCADNDELAEESARLILYHDPNGSNIHVAPKGEMHSGWVIGTYAVEE